MRKLALLSLTKFSNLHTPAHPFKEFLFASIQQKEVMESCQGQALVDGSGYFMDYRYAVIFRDTLQMQLWTGRKLETLD